MSEREKTETVPPLIPSSEDMIRVGLHSWGITSGDCKNPILRTQGILYMGISLYDKKTQIAGLLHMDVFSFQRYSEKWIGPYKDIEMLMKAMQENSESVGSDCFDASIVRNPAFKPWLTEVTQEVLQSKFNITSAAAFEGSSMAIDARDGRVFRIGQSGLDGQEDDRDNLVAGIKMKMPALKTTDERSLGLQKFHILKQLIKQRNRPDL